MRFVALVFDPRRLAWAGCSTTLSSGLRDGYDLSNPKGDMKDESSAWGEAVTMTAFDGIFLLLSAYFSLHRKSESPSLSAILFAQSIVCISPSLTSEMEGSERDGQISRFKMRNYHVHAQNSPSHSALLPGA